MFNVIKRCNKLHKVIGLSKGSVITSSHQTRAQTLYHLRLHAFGTIRFCSTTGNGFRTLGIAGSNIILRHINDDFNNCNIYQQKQIRSFSQQKKKKRVNENWNKKQLHGVDYQNDEMRQEFIDNDKKHEHEKSFDFEHLEFLKAKHRNIKQAQSATMKIQSTSHSQRTYSNQSNVSNESPIESNIEQPTTTAPSSAHIPHAPRSFAVAQSQQIMAKEDEINPTSVGGLFVLLVGAAIFYWLFNIDQQKHSEVSSFLSRFTRTISIDDFIKQQETKPIHKIEDEWRWYQVVIDHIKNLVQSPFTATKYNSEWIWSKLFRLFYIPSSKLLPPVKANIYTLVIDIDTICHSTWSRNDGFERSMRPNYSEFLSRMALCGWEVVLFGQCEQYDWEETPDIVKLDGKGFVSHYLWNSSAYYFNGHRCKDLSRLNRDLKRVIVIDSDPRSVQLQPENAIILKKWKNNQANSSSDTSLLKLIEFLEYLAKAEVTDVRQVLAAYRGKDIAQEFRKRYFDAIKAQLTPSQIESQIESQKEGAYIVDDEQDEDGEQEMQEMYE